MSTTTKSPLQAIYAKCLECSAGDKKEILECPVSSCPLFPYRTTYLRTKVELKTPSLFTTTENKDNSLEEDKK